MKWQVIISKSDNGYTVVYEGDNVYDKVYQEKNEDDETNKDHILLMLYDLLEHFDETDSKHSKRRICICYKRGSNYLGKDNPQEGVEFDVIE